MQCPMCIGVGRVESMGGIKKECPTCKGKRIIDGNESKNVDGSKDVENKETDIEVKKEIRRRRNAQTEKKE